MERKIGTPRTTVELMKKHNIFPNKALGQNFLVDHNILEKIVAAGEIKSTDHLIEIGPGLGALTQRLAEVSGWLTVIEKDERLIPVLNEVLDQYTNISFVVGDILKMNWEQLIAKDFSATEQLPLEKSLKVIANLPYYITTPIIMGLFERRLPIELMVFMVQREVAERMVAKPGTKTYGGLSIAVQFYAKPEIVTLVPPTVFIPRPNVDSAVIKLTSRRKPAVDVLNEDIFFRVVKAAFQQRRKTLRNSLSGSPTLSLTKELVLDALEKVDIDPQLRGEKLSISDFGRLSDQIFKLLNT